MQTHKELADRLAKRLLENFTSDQIRLVTDNLMILLENFDITEKTTAIVTQDSDIKTRALQMFFVSKKMEGCTDNTIQYYGLILRQFFKSVNTRFEDISADDIRIYIARLAIESKLSKTTQDNQLRVLKSFFKWCFGEGYIKQQPTINIKCIKQEKRIKKAFSETELEMLRQTAGQVAKNSFCEKLRSARDLAIIDTLFSTGVRVSELANMKISDISGDEIIVFGKGEKERVVYLNARAKLSIQQYLEIRTDSNKALFISVHKPFNQLEKASIEVIVRKIGEKCGVENVHPHRFRRSAATLALNRGMPIEQVSKMLGHENIETTTIYARSSDENVKASHKKYVI